MSTVPAYQLGALPGARAWRREASSHGDGRVVHLDHDCVLPVPADLAVTAPGMRPGVLISVPGTTWAATDPYADPLVAAVARYNHAALTAIYPELFHLGIESASPTSPGRARHVLLVQATDELPARLWEQFTDLLTPGAVWPGTGAVPASSRALHGPTLLGPADTGCGSPSPRLEEAAL